jgi:hypothetical protein
MVSNSFAMSAHFQTDHHNGALLRGYEKRNASHRIGSRLSVTMEEEQCVI